MATRRKAIATVRDLTSWAHKEHAKVRTRQRKALREDRSVFSAELFGHKSNRLIDARIDFYGQYIQLNEQVTLGVEA